MDRIAAPIVAAVAAAGVALLAVGCGGNAGSGTGADAGSASAVRALPSPFTITARYTAQALGLNYPDSLAIGPDGNVYVTDLSQRVTVISPAGIVLRRWGKRGSKPGEFNFVPADPTTPTDIHGKIAVGPDGKVYVSDSGNARVEAFTADGRFIGQFGSFGSGKGQFLHPFDIAVDGAGNIYVVDGQTDTLSKFSPAGEVIWQFGGTPADLGDGGCCFNFTAFDAHGRLVIVNDGQGKVLYLDSTGHVADAFSPDTAEFSDGNMCEITTDLAGNTYVSGCGASPTGPTMVYDREHRLIARWPGTPYSLLRSPVFGPDGEVFALAVDGSILRLHVTLPGT
jgi:DNA-binding beta-propeller fold protein YncE